MPFYERGHRLGERRKSARKEKGFVFLILKIMVPKRVYLVEDAGDARELTKRLVEKGRPTKWSFWSRRCGAAQLELADRVFAFLEVMVPKRVYLEDVGDARELIARMVEEGRPQVSSTAHPGGRSKSRSAKGQP